MLTFLEYIQARSPLPDPLTMLTRLGIDLDGPSEVEVKRIAKRQEKRDGLAKVHKASAKP
jgi:hypothetical protein